MKKLAIILMSVLLTVQVFSQTSVTVVSPNGGENWITGCPYAIQWLSTNTTGTVKIELFKNNVFNMTICPQAPPGMTSYTWIPPFNLIPGNNFKVKITSLTSAAAFDFSDNVFAISQGSLQVSSPNGGETWEKGTMHPILWTDNLCDNVRIELWKGGLFNLLIAASVPSNGTFNWTVPNLASLVPGNDYKVKIMRVPAGNTATLVFDFSDNNFTIAPGQNTAPITLITPNGGENWIIGCPNLIQWVTAAVPSSPVKIELYKNNLFCMTICPQVPIGQNVFTWVPPWSLLPANTYKVKVSLLTSASGFDFSDGNFSINTGNVTVNSPNGGETWVKGTMHPILWTDNLCDNVRIELWKGGVFNSLIAVSVPSNGTFNWTIPNVATLVPGNDYRVKVMNVIAAGITTNLVYDFSDNAFTIASAPGNTTITVVAPNGGENWVIGCPNLIQWVTAAVPSSPVKIELYKNDLFCMTICPQVPSGQSVFTWVPPWSLLPATNYKVKVTLLTGSAGYDFSNGYFSINSGSITVNSPNGGETWVKGTMHPITWTDNLCDNVRIELWKGGVFNSLISASVPSNGIFNWMIPNVNTLVPGNDYKVKVMSLSPAGTSNSLAFDFSDNTFSIMGNSPPTGIGLSGKISIYPNPFADQLHVMLPVVSEVSIVIEIRDLNGDLMLSKKANLLPGKETVELNTRQLPAGRYLLLLKTDNKLVSQHHVLLVR